MDERTMIAAAGSSNEMVLAQQPGIPGFASSNKLAPTTDVMKISQPENHIEQSYAPNARPPKAPKPNQAAMQTRSSSKPRSSLSMDDNSKQPRRSESQPHSSQSHFLHGINVDDCFDVRSIPDPPSPVVHHNRRRLSTPDMMSSTMRLPCGRLEDVTNQEMGEERSVNSMRNSSKKRKRLSHVHSPRTMDEEHRRNAPVSRLEAEANFDERADAPSRASQDSSTVCLEDEELEYSRRNQKRCNKRQSMVVPTQLSLETNSSSPSMDLYQSFEGAPPPSQRRNFAQTKQSMEELRAMVRGYCCGTTEKRGPSAKAIKEMTGYVMPGSVTAINIVEGDRHRTEKEILETRRSVFLKISPAMMEMENQKQLDIKRWEDNTGCRVEKSTKSSKYKYYTIENHKRVGSQEYKRRYMTVLEYYRPMRAASAQDWIDALWERENKATMPCENSQEQETTQISDVISAKEAWPVVAHPNGWKETRVADQVQQQPDAFLPPKSSLEQDFSYSSREDNGDTMEICDVSVSLDHGNPDTIEFSIDSNTLATSNTVLTLAEIVEVSSEDTAETDVRTSTPSPFVLDGDQSLLGCSLRKTQEARPVLVAQSCDEGTEEPIISKPFSKRTTEAPCETPLLPFPDRDCESLDPNIAQAERNLWAKIDAALKEYSEEIMMIMKAKETGSGSSTEGTAEPK